MYLGCRFYPFVYVEFSRIPLEKSGLHIFPCTINCQTRVRATALGTCIRYASTSLPRASSHRCRRGEPKPFPHGKSTRRWLPARACGQWCHRSVLSDNPLLRGLQEPARCYMIGFEPQHLGKVMPCLGKPALLGQGYS